MFEHFTGVDSLVRVVADHFFKNVLEQRRRGDFAVDLPEVLLALEGQLFVVGVVWERSSEWLVFDRHQEESRSGRKDVRLDAIIEQVVGLRVVDLVSLTNLINA